VSLVNQWKDSPRMIAFDTIDIEMSLAYRDKMVAGSISSPSVVLPQTEKEYFVFNSQTHRWHMAEYPKLILGTEEDIRQGFRPVERFAHTAYCPGLEFDVFLPDLNIFAIDHHCDQFLIVRWAVALGLIPAEGNTLIHFDRINHSDLGVTHDLFDPYPSQGSSFGEYMRYMREVFSPYPERAVEAINCFNTPLFYDGTFSRMIHVVAENAWQPAIDTARYKLGIYGNYRGKGKPVVDGIMVADDEDFGIRFDLDYARVGHRGFWEYAAGLDRRRSFVGVDLDSYMGPADNEDLSGYDRGLAFWNSFPIEDFPFVVFVTSPGYASQKHAVSFIQEVVRAQRERRRALPRPTLEEERAQDLLISSPAAPKKGLFTIVYCCDVSVLKVVRRSLGGVLKIAEAERDAIARKTVAECRKLAERGYPVPQTWYEGFGRIGQRLATGLEFEELTARFGSNSVKALRATATLNLILEKAGQEFGTAILLDHGLKNATYGQDGALKEWFDPVIPVPMSVVDLIKRMTGYAPPALEEESDLFVPGNAPVSSPATVNPRILVAEDHADALELLVYFLSEIKGAVIEKAADGMDAMGKFAQQDTDILVTDLDMPRMDGYQLAKEIKRSQPGLLIVMQTDNDAVLHPQNSRDQARADEIRQYVDVITSKDPDGVVAAVRRLWEASGWGPLSSPAARKLTLGRLERYYEDNVTPLVRETASGLFAPVYFGDVKKLVRHLPQQPYFRGVRRGADLGSGDGRVVMALAAQDCFESVTGYELDDELFDFSGRVHRDFGSADGIEFKKENFLDADFSGFDFYFYYAKTTDAALLGEKLAREVPAGALVVVYQYQLDGLYSFLKENGFAVVDRLRIPYFSVVDGEVATSFVVLQKAAVVSAPDVPSGL
ncbi:MAG: response regulator, partial [Candidatus Nanoarchaeia archaeon]|nr:response regulator [Candidatus Nanoarchaeia archaeon]